jgi:hypothetical protein
MKGRIEGVEGKLAAAHSPVIGQDKGGGDSLPRVVRSESARGRKGSARRTRSGTGKVIGSRRRRAAWPNVQRIPRKISSTWGLSKAAWWRLRSVWRERSRLR